MSLEGFKDLKCIGTNWNKQMHIKKYSQEKDIPAIFAWTVDFPRGERPRPDRTHGMFIVGVSTFFFLKRRAPPVAELTEARAQICPSSRRVYVGAACVRAARLLAATGPGQPGHGGNELFRCTLPRSPRFSRWHPRVSLPEEPHRS